MAKRIISIMLVILFSFSFVSCNQDINDELPYPNYLTGEYVQEHYELVDMNLVYLQSYHERTSSISGFGTRCRFMQIKDVPLEEFLGVTSASFMTPTFDTYVLFNSTSSINPIYDFEVDGIELYIKKGTLNINSSNFDKCGEVLYDEQICEID